MDAFQPAKWSLVVLCFVMGCITPDPSVDLLEGELRWMEDQLYIMEDELEDRCRELTACREASSMNDAACDCDQGSTMGAYPPSRVYLDEPMDAAYDVHPRQSIEEDTKKPSAAAGSRDELPSPGRQSSPRRTIPQNRELPNLIDTPKTSKPSNGQPPSPFPLSLDTGDDSAGGASAAPAGQDGDEGGLDLDDLDGLLEEPVIEYPSNSTSPPAAPSSTRPEIESSNAHEPVAPLMLSDSVKKLRLNAARVSSHPDLATDAQLLVVVEPQSKEGQYVELSAPVSVVLEDVNQGGIYHRSWDFNALETGRTLRESPMGQGIHLALDWPDDLPILDDLRVLVSYRRIDGKEVRAEKIIHPKARKTSVAGWVPASRSDSGGLDASAESKKTVDPFSLAGPAPVKRPKSAKPFATRPIATTAPSVSSRAETANVSWSDTSEVSRSHDLLPTQGDQLTLIETVKLESIPIEKVPAESQPPRNAPSSAPSSARSVDESADSKWTPFR